MIEEAKIQIWLICYRLEEYLIATTKNKATYKWWIFGILKH